MILVQAITNAGSISANWVLIVLTSLIGVLALIILNDIRNNIKAIALKTSQMETELTRTTESTKFAHKRIDDIKESIA